MMTEVTTIKRQHWIQVLARAGEDLKDFEQDLAHFDYRFIRAPETGMVMARGAAGGNGQHFNLGEVAVTRCVVRMADGVLGHSYVLGRSVLSAKLAALIDALLQGAESEQWFEKIIRPLEQKQRQQRLQREQMVAGSKVQFFTMVRGE